MAKSDIFLPDRWLRLNFPAGFWARKMLTAGVDPKKTAINTLVQAAAITKRDLNGTFDRAIEFYDDKMAKLKADGVRAFKSKALDGEKLLKARLKQLVIYNEVQHQKKTHKGRRYRWLPSGAKEPRPEHQLRYGKIYTEGDGEMPGEAWGCQCGIEWLDD